MFSSFDLPFSSKARLPVTQSSPLTLRPIQSDELERFARFTVPDVERAPDFLAFLHSLLERGDSFPTWCFVAEQDGIWLATAAFRHTAFPEPSVRLIEWALPWHHEPVRLGVALLRHALASLHKQSQQVFERNFEPHMPHLDVQYAVFEQLGIPVARETVQYAWPVGVLPERPTRLTFRSLTDVGGAAFKTAIERSFNGTLDRVDQQEVEQHGAGRHAQAFYEELQMFAAPPTWWELAYDAQGVLVGLVVPAPLGSNEGTVAYLAVMPEQRGHGYGLDILRQGTWTLLRVGLSKIVLNTDVRNLPTQRLNEQVGYRREGIARRYRTDLDRLFEHGDV